MSIWLDVPVEMSLARMAARDGSQIDPAHPSVARYVGAQALYLASCDPAGRADIVIDNSEPGRPIWLR